MRSNIQNRRRSLVILCFLSASCSSGFSAEIRLVGDGTADETQAIQSAIDAGIGDLHFPRGVYRITKTLTVDLDKTGPTSFNSIGTATIIMDAPGPAIRFLGSHEGTAAPDTVTDNVWKNQRAPMVTGLEIIGNHPEANGIEATGTMQLTVTRTILRKLHHGIHLTNRNRNIIVSDCHIYENSGIGIFYDDVSLHQSNIVGCHVSYNKLGGIVSRAGDVRNIHIGTCDIEGNMGGPDSTPSANIELNCIGGSVAEVAITGCTIQHDHISPNSANIRFIGESKPLTFTEELRHGHVTISGNVLSDVQTNIEITNARGVSITGNTIWKGFTNNLIVTGSENIVLSGNTFERNPRYHYSDGAGAKNAIRFENCTGLLINANLIHEVHTNDAGLVLKSCKKANITACSILDCQTAGVLIEDCQQSQIQQCVITPPNGAGDDWKPERVIESRDVKAMN